MESYQGGNRVLDRLPERELAVLAPALAVMAVRLREAAWTAGEPFAHMIFPIDAVYSVLVDFGDGRTAEVGTVGNEGLLPIALTAGVLLSHRTAICQLAGRAARISRSEFNDALAVLPELAKLVRRNMYSRVFIAEQHIGCNVTHGIVERCARWLLSTSDRVGRADFKLTHEFLAMMLGVRRPAVTEAAGYLQRIGAISYRRGHILVTDADRLRGAACECYETDRLGMAAALDGYELVTM
jgi:hypothetical protein